jgi:hypothetical protein
MVRLVGVRASLQKQHDEPTSILKALKAVVQCCVSESIPLVRIDPEIQEETK